MKVRIRGRLVPAPEDVVIGREAFAQRVGGLRLEVRRNAHALGRYRRASVTTWRFDLGDLVCQDPVDGWFFDWRGPDYAAPIRFLAHTDGRFGAEGTSGNGIFQETVTSVTHLIEPFALEDEVSSWDPWPIDGHGLAIAQQVSGLEEIAEASGPMRRWRMGESVAVMEFAYVTNHGPRRRQAWIWTRGEEGHDRVEAAAAAADVAPLGRVSSRDQ